MLDYSVLPLFFTTVFFLVISPGPDLLLISTYSSSKGFKSGLMLSAGVFIAGILQTLLVAFGLGQLMQSMPVFAVAIKTLGALYLGYLGLRMLYTWWLNQQTQPTQQAVRNIEKTTDTDLVIKGFLNNLLNPKALLFFSLFLPQFTTQTTPLSGQILILGLLLSGFALLTNLVFALSFSQFAKLLGNKSNLTKHVDALLGVVFLGLATRLAISK